MIPSKRSSSSFEAENRNFLKIKFLFKNLAKKDKNRIFQGIFFAKTEIGLKKFYSPSQQMSRFLVGSFKGLFWKFDKLSRRNSFDILLPVTFKWEKNEKHKERPITKLKLVAITQLWKRSWRSFFLSCLRSIL